MRLPVTSDPLTALLEHNHWATRRVLDLCGRVSPEQFQERFEIGPGSLHDTLRHLIHNMRAWADDIAGRPNRPAPGKVTVEDLGRLLDESTDELRTLVEQSRDRLGDFVRVQFRADGPTFSFTRGVALTHVFVHGTHHRAQCLNMLRRLNIPGLSDALPDLDLNEWQTETECRP